MSQYDEEFYEALQKIFEILESGNGMKKSDWMGINKVNN